MKNKERDRFMNKKKKQKKKKKQSGFGTRNLTCWWRALSYIILTPLNPTIVKLGFTRVYIVFLISS